MQCSLTKVTEKKVEFGQKCGFNPDQVNLKFTPRKKKDFYECTLQIEQASIDGETCELPLAPCVTTAEFYVQATKVLHEKIIATARLMESFPNLLKYHLKEKVLQEKDILEGKAAYTYSEGEFFYIRIGAKTPEDRFELRYVGYGLHEMDAVKNLAENWEM